ncbi:hypothetical protein GCM10027299_31360 [Larkinella ripae]
MNVATAETYPPLLADHYYHIYNHANGTELLFREPDNYRYFLKKYADHCISIADTFSYCLIPNHFHAIIRIKTVAELIAHFEIQEPS